MTKKFTRAAHYTTAQGYVIRIYPPCDCRDIAGAVFCVKDKQEEKQVRLKYESYFNACRGYCNAKQE